MIKIIVLLLLHVCKKLYRYAEVNSTELLLEILIDNIVYILFFFSSRSEGVFQHTAITTDTFIIITVIYSFSHIKRIKKNG